MEYKEAYFEFFEKIADEFGLTKPIDILRLCMEASLFMEPYEQRIKSLEEQIQTVKNCPVCSCKSCSQECSINDGKVNC